MGGYQLPLALTIFRGRYRESLETATAIEPGKVLEYRFDLPNANHTIQPGHRLMVQVQSTLFQLSDRNPTTYVPNIFRSEASRDGTERAGTWNTRWTTQ